MKKNLLKFYSLVLFSMLAFNAYTQCTVSSPNVNVNGSVITFTANGTGAVQPTYVWDFGNQSGFSTDQTGTYTYPAPGTYNVCVTYVDASNPTSCFDQQCTSITITATEIGEVNVNEYEAYPNPASDELYIKSDKRIEAIEIMDITGKVIFKEDYNINIVRLELSSLTSGFYFTRVRINGVIYTQKIQKL